MCLGHSEQRRLTQASATFRDHHNLNIACLSAATALSSWYLTPGSCSRSRSLGAFSTSLSQTWQRDSFRTATLERSMNARGLYQPDLLFQAPEEYAWVPLSL